MSGTHVYSNGVLLRDCETLEFSQVIEMDESQTHERFMKTRITVASTLISIFRKGESTPLSVSQQHRSTIRIPSISDETMVGRAEEIMQLLSEPRKDFWYAVNGVADPQTDPAVVASPNPPREDRSDNSSYRLFLVATGILPASGDSEFVQLLDQSLTVKRVNVLDANNGPKPSGIDIQKVYGGNVLRVQATFEICRVLSKPVTDDNVDPGYDAQQVRGVISNTWSVVDGLDDDGAVTHTVSGKLCVKDQRYKANAMRMFAFPLAFPYARLTNRQHIVDETGLVLQYNYQFKHAGAAPPAGIRKYEATYGEEIRAGSSPVQTAFMNVKVMGWHDQSLSVPVEGGGNVPVPVLAREQVQKYMLLRGLYTILWSRIRGINKLWDPIPGHKPNTVNLVRAMVLERTGLPQMELRVEVKYTAQDDTEFHNRLTNMGLPIDIAGYDPRWWPIDNEWGRLPNGSGVAGNQGDKDNPNFAMPAYPYAESGDPTKSDYFTGYFQSPGSNRHTLPRITGATENNFADTSMEWARPGGSVPTDASAAPSSLPGPDTMNPISGPVFSAIVYKNLTGTAYVFGASPPAVNAAYSGVSNLQRSGFMYLRWESEVKSSSNEGKIMLPLSKPRNLTDAQKTSLGLSIGSGTPAAVESSVSVRLSAAQSERVYSVTATRFGKWPQIPEPAKQIVRTTQIPPSGTSTSPNTVLQCVETLLNKEVLTETPELTANQTDREFTLHARYRYGMSNPWAGDSTEGGNDFETLPVGESPVDKATAVDNAITIRGSVATDSPLFRSDAQYG